MTALVVVLASCLAVAVVVLVLLLRRENRSAGRLAAVIDRLEPSRAPEIVRPLRDEVDRLERAAGRVGERASEATNERIRLERALHAIPQGVVLRAIDGTVLFRNQAATTYAAARHGDALVEAAIDQLLADAIAGLPGSETLDLFGPPRRSLVVTALPLGGPAGAEGAVAVIEDVTERRRLEAVRRDFVANISHELKTPVGAMALLAETLLAEDERAIRDRLAERMLLEADRVGRTIEDLLTLSQIETEEAPAREPVAVAQIFAEAADRMRPGAEQRDITLEVTPPSHRLGIECDRRQVVSALYNLLDNAVKYSDPGSVVQVSAVTDGRRVDIEVQDHGMGIPSADLERIFERFYRVDQARSRQTGGTGLGLAIVRHVANNHDGEVHVESRAGEGSTFTLRLPVASGPVVVTTAEAS